MTLDSEPPPKRIRTKNKPTTESIAETNSHLRAVLAGRHNRWMHGFAGSTPTATNSMVNQNESGDAGRSNSRVSSREGWNTFERSTQPLPSIPTPASQQHQQQQQSSELRQMPLVARQLPSSDETILGVPTPVVNGRKEAFTRSCLPGLPSPAPSDEITDSPYQQARSIVPTRQFGEIVQPTAPQRSPYVSAARSQHFAQNAQQVPAQFALFQHRNTTGLEHQRQFSEQSQQRRPIPANIQMANSPSVLAPSVPASNSARKQQQTQPHPTAPAACEIYMDIQLLEVLGEAETRIGATTTLSAVDRGRLELLREAVRQGDWFCMILSQLFCLRTTSPKVLPQSVSDVNDICYEYVSTLLCANTEINYDLLHVFADFPRPLMAIYSGSFRDSFEILLQAVKGFLESLPIQWDGLVADCKSIPSPPLAQDLDQRLQLKSPVLQATAFRAIAKVLYDFPEGDQRGRAIAAIEKLHELDRNTYFGLNFVRNDLEKQEAYEYLKRVFAICGAESQRLGGQVKYKLPQGIVDYFQRPPKSMQQLQQQPYAQLLQQPNARLLQQPHAQLLPSQLSQQIRTQRQHQAEQMRCRQQANEYGFQHSQHPVQEHWLPAQGPGSSIHNAQTYLHPPLSGLQRHQPRTASVSGSSHAFHAGAQANHLVGIPSRLYPQLEQTPSPQPAKPNPAISALHQAHLRSPILRPASPAKDGPGLYRYVTGFGVPPTTLKPSLVSQTITFQVSPEIWTRVAKDDPPSKLGEPSRRSVHEDSLMFRLRCSTLPPSGFPTEHAWVTADNFWPEYFYFEFNGNTLETRRKLHYGRYLPVDLTAYMKEGRNEIRVFQIKQALSKTNEAEYALAIEAIGVKSHHDIVNMIPRIPASESLNTIQRSLAGTDTGSRDEDAAVTSQFLTIKLFEPYSQSKMFDTPVRGAECLHKECFDLETYLSMCRREKPDWPTVVDCWKCPLCSGDVRPQTLVLDEFLLQVRQDLASKNLLDTKEITIDAYGSWKPKLEESSDVRSLSLEREELGSIAAATRDSLPPPAAPNPKIEVIELD